MAVIFELVVNFGSDVDAARAASLIAATSPPLKAGRHRIPLHPALITEESSEYAGSPPYAQLSILPVAVGYGVATDGTLPRIALTAEELTELGRGLYGLLAQFGGYQVAMVGWDPESLVDTAYLREDMAEELATGAPNGLVISDVVHDALGAGESFAAFAPGFVWIPWQGAKRSTLTL